MAVKKMSLDEYRAVYRKVPRLCVDLLIRKENSIMLILREIDPGKGLWHFPGGTVLKGEHTEQAVSRISLEETGLVPSRLKFAGVMEFCNTDNLFYHTVSLVYEVQTDSASPRGSFQGREIAFFEKLPEKMIQEQKKLLYDLGLFPSSFNQ